MKIDDQIAGHGSLGSNCINGKINDGRGTK